jgi:hypothetical protein
MNQITFIGSATPDDLTKWNGPDYDPDEEDGNNDAHADTQNNIEAETKENI